MKRMKVYCQYSYCKTLAPTKGDFVNEIGLLMAMSRFAEVYYSGSLFCPDAPDYNLVSYPEPPEERVPQDCDIYYVRANKAVFKRCPKPRIWMASPYDSWCYNHADAIATFSEEWARVLQVGESVRWIPDEENIPRPTAISFDQVVLDSFTPLRNDPRTTAIRERVGGSFIVGHFGRIVKSNYPHALFALWPEFARNHPDARLLLGLTTVKEQIPALPGLIRTTFQHDDMPYAISACDVIMLSNWGREWDVCGCGKALEAAACGVPSVLGRSPAREELFGADYPYFLPPLHGPDIGADVGALRDVLESAVAHPEVFALWGKALRGYSGDYSVEGGAKRLKAVFTHLINKKRTGVAS